MAESRKSAHSTPGDAAIPGFLDDYALFVQQLVEDISAEVDLKSVTLELENPPPAVKLLLNPARLAVDSQFRRR